MKKILWLVILLPIFMTRVLASEVYYTNYGDFSDYQEEYVSGSDIVNVEESIMYKWYKNIKVPGEYKLYNAKDTFLDNCYESSYSNWSNDCPSSSEAIIIDEKTIYNYEMVKPIRYIHLYNLQGSYGAFRITELQVYNELEKINYDYRCEGCWDSFNDYINNNIHVENNSYIDNNGSLVIDLKKEYPINKIKILFYLFDMGNDDKKYTIGYSNDGKNIFISKDYSHKFSSEYLKDVQKFEYTINDLSLSKNLWLEEKNSEEYIDNEFVYSVNSYQQYRYKEKMCQTYSLKKEYYPQYSLVSIDDYTLKDSEKKFYRYQTRDKLEINIYDITEKNFDLNNFVISSTDNYTISHNINWDKNGDYNVSFVLNDLIVDKNVNVKILSNSLEEKDNEINDLKQQLQGTKNNYENIINNLQQTNENYLKTLDELNKKIIDLNNKIETINNDNLKEIENIKQELSSYINDYNSKLDELYNLNKNNVDSLENLENEINELKNKINDLVLQNNDINSDIKKLEEKLNESINIYNQKIKELEQLNEDSFKKLEDINIKINDINEQLKDLKVISQQQFFELETKILNNSESLSNLQNSLSGNIESINDEINLIKQEIEEFKNKTNKNYNNITSKLEALDNNVFKDLDNLKIKLDNITTEILKLKEDNILNKDELELLKKQLEENINLYKLKINELNDINSEHLEYINNLNNQTIELKEKLDNIEKNNISNKDSIINLENNIKQNLNLYTEHVDKFNSFSDKYVKELNEMNLKINKLIINLDELGVINFDIRGQLNNVVDNNNAKIKIIEEQLKKYDDNYQQIYNNQQNLTDKIDNYENIIMNLKQLNENYLIQINLLNNEIIKINEKIDSLKQENSFYYNNYIENQRLINDQLSENIKTTKLYNEQFEDFKIELLQLKEKTEYKNEGNLNSKLNNFTLRINGLGEIDLLWLYILLFLLFVFYIIYLFKKRNKTNNS